MSNTQISKRNKKETYQLEIQSNDVPQESLAAILQQLFSDQYIFVHKDFRKTIQQNRKGYIDLEELLNVSAIYQFFKRQMIQARNQIFFLAATIKNQCFMFLHLNYFKVRRIYPFDHDLMKDIKPICLQRVSQEKSISDIREWFGQNCITSTQVFHSRQRSHLNLIYSFNYRQRLKNQEQQQEMPFKILKYADLCKQKERQSRFWQNQEKNCYKQFQYKAEVHYPQINNHQFSQQSFINQSQLSKQSEQSNKSHFLQLIKQPNAYFNQALKCCFSQNSSTFLC